ncbi:cytochrome P450 [Steroidobacter sp. S1-65]|uniref:Cytochrome P450 n=2 Tax=Steroidobacter gossypii TaxID=2805490 RepID=A0ABS1X5R8_9GAMM|nr:cytochrome P450 [Steroidobacter gossypii]
MARQQMTQTLSQLDARYTWAIASLDRDPHEIFRKHRPMTPLLKREDGVYIAIRAADVEALITDPRTRQLETQLARARGVVDGPLLQFMANTLLLSNGVQHRQRRAPLAKAFAFDLMTELRPRVRSIAEQLIDQHYRRGAMDFISDFANWLPARVICAILGVPESDIPDFTRRVYSLARALSSSFSQEDVPELQRVSGELISYVHDLLEDRRLRPREDFLTSYATALDGSETLSNVEALVQIVTLLLAGSDTTRGALAIQTSLLLEHREQWNAVCKDSTLIPGAVLECLRYEPSVASFARVTVDDIALDGVMLPRGHIVSLSTLSALRDPSVYADPDKFDIRRTDHPRRHLVFGGGVHRCLGETLAKIELQEALAALSERLPNLELDGGPAIVHGSGGIRSVRDLRVRWAA